MKESAHEPGNTKLIMRRGDCRSRPPCLRWPRDDRRAGFAQRHHDHRREATPAARPEVRRRDQGQRRAIKSLVAAARGAAQGRPNVLLIMTDDVGFGAPSTFGGVIPTPALDRIAKAGLRYTQFHSTALCSPTRAALITGRNHHSAGFGVVSEQSTGFPGYNSIIPKDKATIGRILKDNGFATSWFGKDHNTPTFQASQVGPFDQWPIGMGFEYFYGFVGGDTSQWQPNLFRNTTADLSLRRPSGVEPDHRHGRRRHRLAEPAQPDRPEQAVLLLLRARRHARAASRRRRSGSRRSATCTCSTRAGTNCASEIFANQKRLGVIPQDAKMTPWPDKLLKKWDALTRRREEAVHPPGGGLCRLSRLHRPRDRPRDSGRRRHGQARQHADHLHQRRQRFAAPKARWSARPTRSPCSTASRSRSRTS